MPAVRLATAFVQVETRGMKDVQQDFQQARGMMSRGLAALGTQMAGVFGGMQLSNLVNQVGRLAVAFTAASVKMAAAAETSAVQFRVLVGDANKAEKLLSDIRDFAASTPFGIPGLQQSAQTLLAFGIHADNIIPTLRMLGDIAGGDAEKLRGVTLAFAQISSTGRLMGQDLLQLINAGFNPLQVISERTGESMTDLKKRMEAGKVSFDEVRQAFIAATSEGGRFHGMMQQMSETSEGLWSTMLDDIDAAKREFGELILQSIDVKGVIKEVSEAAQDFGTAVGRTPELAEGFANLGDAIQNLGEAMTGETDRVKQFNELLKDTATVMDQLADAIEKLEALGRVGQLLPPTDAGGLLEMFSDPRKFTKEWKENLDELIDMGGRDAQGEFERSQQLDAQRAALDERIRKREEAARDPRNAPVRPPVPLADDAKLPDALFFGSGRSQLAAEAARQAEHESRARSIFLQAERKRLLAEAHSLPATERGKFFLKIRDIDRQLESSMTAGPMGFLLGAANSLAKLPDLIHGTTKAVGEAAAKGMATVEEKAAEKVIASASRAALDIPTGVFGGTSFFHQLQSSLFQQVDPQKMLVDQSKKQLETLGRMEAIEARIATRLEEGAIAIATK